MKDDHPIPRPGQVWFNWSTGTTAVVCGRMLPKGCRVLLFKMGVSGSLRYSRWVRAPKGYRMIKEPRR